MGKINWGRMFLCGLLAGAAWLVFIGIIVAAFASDFAAAVQASGHPFPPTGIGARVFLVIGNFAVAIWTMWLYAAIRPRYGPGPKTAVIAGLALWTIGGATDAFWVLLGFIPPQPLLTPVAAALPAILLAAVVGAWLYKE